MTDDLLYNLPQGEDSQSLQDKIERLTYESSGELARLLRDRGISESDARLELVHPFKLTQSAAGFGAADVALVVSLAPLIATLTPLLKPFANAAAEVAKTVALEYWEHTRQKLWKDESVQLRKVEKRKRKQTIK
jgi:hypothetical protein